VFLYSFITSHPSEYHTTHHPHSLLHPYALYRPPPPSPSPHIPVYSVPHCTAALKLLSDGASVPFVARYRRAETGDCSAEILFDLDRALSDYQATCRLREKRLATLRGSTPSKLTGAVAALFAACVTTTELDAVWSEVKEKKTPKATEMAAYNIGIGTGTGTGADSIISDLLSGAMSHYRPPTAAREWRHSPWEVITYLLTSAVCGSADAKAIVVGACKGNNVVVKCKEKREAKASSSSSSRSGKTTTSSSSSVAAADKFAAYVDRDMRLSSMAPHQVLAVRRAKDMSALTVRYCCVYMLIPKTSPNFLLTHYGKSHIAT